MEFQCIAEEQNSRGLRINVKKSDQPPLVCYPTSRPVSHLQPPYSQFAMASPNSIVLIFELQGIHEKINKLRIKNSAEKTRDTVSG